MYFSTGKVEDRQMCPLLADLGMANANSSLVWIHWQGACQQQQQQEKAFPCICDKRKKS